METTGERHVRGVSDEGLDRFHVVRYQYAARHVRDERVIDVACGTGSGSALLAEAGAKNVIGIDLAEQAVRYASERYRASNLRYRTGNAQSLSGIADGSADVVVSFETIEHLHDIDAYLGEVERVLRPGGTFILSTPDRRLVSALYPIFRRPKTGTT